MQKFAMLMAADAQSGFMATAAGQAGSSGSGRTCGVFPRRTRLEQGIGLLRPLEGKTGQRSVRQRPGAVTIRSPMNHRTQPHPSASS